MEDYKERYEQTLERAREAKQNTESAVTIGILEEIFPELCDSGDEKVRKELIKVFSNREKYLIDQSFGDITVGEVLAWLEKQKPIMAENEKWLIDETLYFLDEFQQSDRCYSENEMQNSITCKNWLKLLKQRIGG